MTRLMMGLLLAGCASSTDGTRTGPGGASCDDAAAHDLPVPG